MTACVRLKSSLGHVQSAGADGGGAAGVGEMEAAGREEARGPMGRARKTRPGISSMRWIMGSVQE
eukprot:9278227-Pyramimonas_sp.AAC.2